jgi:hypothetical protein
MTVDDMNEVIGPHATPIEDNMRRWLNNFRRVTSVHRHILVKYLTTPGGRQQIAESMLRPFVNNIAFLKHELDSGSRTHESVAQALQDLVVEMEDYLAILPREERFLPQSSKLRDLLISAVNIINGHQEDLASSSSQEQEAL